MLLLISHKYCGNNAVPLDYDVKPGRNEHPFGADVADHHNELIPNQKNDNSKPNGYGSLRVINVIIIPYNSALQLLATPHRRCNE